MKFEPITISSIKDIIDNLTKQKENVRGQIWYRGHAKESWKLEPSLFRPENNWKTEMGYIVDFKKDALLLVDQIPKELYEWLFIMRHNHLPTRLLDWSENPLIALYFAIFEQEKKCKDEEEENAVLWMLAPLELNDNITELKGNESLPSFDEDKEDALEYYTPENYDNLGNKGDRYPISFIAPRNTKRMQAQQSVFTIHHRKKDPIEEIYDKKHIWKYIIPKEAKNNIKKELRLFGINSFQVYPEITKIYQKIKEERN